MSLDEDDYLNITNESACSEKGTPTVKRINHKHRRSLDIEEIRLKLRESLKTADFEFKDYLLKNVATKKIRNPFVTSLLKQDQLQQHLDNFIRYHLLLSYQHLKNSRSNFSEELSASFAIINTFNEDIAHNISTIGGFTREILQCTHSRCRKYLIHAPNLNSTIGINTFETDKIITSPDFDKQDCAVPGCLNNTVYNHIVFEPGMYNEDLQYQESGQRKVLTLCRKHMYLFDLLFSFVHMRWNIYCNCRNIIETVLEENKLVSSFKLIQALIPFSFYEMRVEEVSGGEQERLLEQAVKVVRAESFEMKRCLDKGKIMDALKHAMNFLTELKTNDLSPKFYYRLYMDAVNELHHLESFLVDEYERNETSITSLNLYECVQYAASIVPRLYLLVTIGVVYIKCGLGSRPEILNDIVEMCRGVQHPLRGLFLRNYLLQTTRSLLPDFPCDPSKQEDENSDSPQVPTAADEESNLPSLADNEDQREGTVKDAVAFILLNFAEMNKLWVRMQHQGPTKERERREKDRMELRILVGTNLVRLSQLEKLTDEMYIKEVFPSILEQVVSCKDHISQEYLMECVIQVFDDEKHFATLRDFLNACGELSAEVNVKNILIALIDRLAIYATQPNSKGIPAHLQLFDIFSEQSKELIKARPEMPMEDIVALHNALVSLAIKCYPEKTEFCNITFGSLKFIFEEKGVQAIEAFGPVGRELSKLLRLPVDEYNNVLRVAELTEYVPVMETMDYKGRCQNAAYLIQNMLDQETLLKTEENLAVVCALVDSLLVNQQDQGTDAHESEDFEDEQRLLARIVHLIQAETVDDQFLLLNNLRKVLGAGGKYRIKFTLAPVVFSMYKLITRYAQERDDAFDEKVNKMFVCTMGTIGALISTAELDELPFKLYLEGAIVSDKVNFENSATITYEFMSKALSVLEDEIADSRDRVRCLALSVGSLLKIQHLYDESWSPLASQMVLAASKMFKKADQVRSLCSCANLFWSGQTAESNGPLRNESKVSDVIRKSIKIATQCMEPIVQQQLFVHILETCLFFYFDGCKEISEDSISELVTRTKDNAVQLDVSAEADALDKQFAAVLQFVKSKKSDFPSLNEKLHL